MKVKHSNGYLQFLKENSYKYDIYNLVRLVKEKFNYDVDVDVLRKYLKRHNLTYKKIKPYVVKNTRYIGDERLKNSRGYTEVKTSDGKWKYKQRYLYEQYHNIELPDDIKIIFLDGDKSNYDITNLVAVTDKEFQYMMSLKVFSGNPDVTELGLQVAKLKTKIKEIEEGKNNE
jgi:hypothetical protein